MGQMEQAPKVSRDSPNAWLRAEPHSGAATQEVKSRFALASAMANEAWGRAEETLVDLEKVVIELEEELEGEIVSRGGPTLRLPPPQSFHPVPVVPLFTGTAAPKYKKDTTKYPDFKPITNVTYPDFPGKHTAVAPSDPDLTPHSVRDVDFPGKPTLNYGTAPELTEVDLPDVPEDIDPPDWEGPDLPPASWLTAIQTALATHFEHDDIGEYTSDLLSEISSALSSIVIDGGTGLHPDVEDAIYDRAKTRLDLERIRRRDEATNMIAGRGFNLPTGVLASMLTEAENEFSRQLREVNMDILVKQAELAQANTHHAHQLTVQLETALMQDWASYGMRSLEVSKANFGFYVEKLKMNLDAYTARIQAYAAYAGAYSEMVKANLAKVEVYKAQVQGEEAKVRLQEAEVKAYESFLRGVATRVDVWKLELEAAEQELKNEMLKVEEYKIQYDAFNTRVLAYRSEIEAHSTDVQSIAEEIRGKRLQLEGEIAENQNKVQERAQILQEKMMAIEEYKAEVSYYVAELQKYKTDFDAYVARIGAQQQQEVFKLDHYKADLALSGQEFDSEIRQYAAEVQRDSAQANLDMEKSRVQIEQERQNLQLRLERLKHVTGVLSQVTASALGAVNASANIGFNASWNAGISNAFSQSYGDSRSDSGSTSYSRSDSKSA